MGDEALGVAHDAKNLATRAMTKIETIEPHLATIVSNITEMRRENSEQHRENARQNSENFKEVHSRISTIKSTIDINRATSAGEIKAVDDKLSARISTHAGIWAKHKDKLMWLMLVILLGLLGDKLGFKVPGL